MTDADLIRHLLAGDEEVIELARSWIRAALLPYRTRLASDLEDVEQEVLLHLTAALRAGRFRRQSRLQTYVRTYAHHKCIDRLRALSRRKWLNVEDLDLPSRAPSQLDQLSSSQSIELALRVVEEMPASCRDLWQMLRQGMRYKEMSQRLGVTEGTLRARVLRCRKRAIEARARLLEATDGRAG